MRKLTHQDAAWRVIKSLDTVKLHPHLRVGQVLFNSLPNDLMESIKNTEKDFFYTISTKAALKMFYEHCVE